MTVAELTFREGRRADLRAAYGLFERAVNSTAGRMGATAVSHPLDEAQIEANWQVERPLLEFMAAQPGGNFWVCEREGELAGFARVVRFGRMQELTEVSVEPSQHGRGIGRELLQHCWPGDPTKDTGRVVVAAGSVVDLSLCMGFGVMPITGHWHLQQATQRFVELRSQQIDRDEPAVHALEAGRAVEEWKRLEPAAIGHERPDLHDFFGRERTCLATMGTGERASGLCWISPAGQIGPAVGERPQDLVPVVLAALDRIARMQEPEELHVFCTTDSWWLLRRLGALGFRVAWPSWVMCSEPLPGLDRYLPTWPALVLQMMRELSQRAAAAGVLVIAAYVLFKLALGVVSAVAWTIVGVVALVAFLWALNRVLQAVEIAVVLFFFGLSAGVIGKIKGSSFFIWFLIGLVLPGIGTLAALLYRFDSQEPRRACPECGRVQPVHVQVCTGCGRDLQLRSDLLDSP